MIKLTETQEITPYKSLRIPDEKLKLLCLNYNRKSTLQPNRKTLLPLS